MTPADPSDVRSKPVKTLSSHLWRLSTGRGGFPPKLAAELRATLEQLGFTIAQRGAGVADYEGVPAARFVAAPRTTGLPVRRATHWASAFAHSCRWLGEVLREDPVPLHRCHSTPRRCVLTEADRMTLLRSDEELVREVGCCQTCPLKQSTPPFITTARLWDDVKRLVAKLPPDVTQVAGVARSGLHAASLISMLLHVPLVVIRQTQQDVVEAGNGWRLKGRGPQPEGTTLVVDDTVMTGNSLKAVSGLVARHFPRALFAAVYVNPFAKRKPDLWAVDLPWPHLLEWNLFNSVLSPLTAFDFDGVLCGDCPPGDDDDGPRYEAFLEHAPPLYLARKTAIPLIVTARLDKYRGQTTAWLKKWNVRVEELVMGPWRTRGERAREDVAAFKAEHYRRFVEKHRRRRPKPPLFVESDPRLARRIAELAGQIVVCPAAGRCFP